MHQREKKDVAPDEWAQDGWKDFGEVERQWYRRYVKATTHGNMEILQELCEEAPTDQFERIKEEVIYERHAYERNRYTIPTSRFPRYSELDYSWAAPRRATAKDEVHNEYYGDSEEADYLTSANKKVKSK